MNILFSLLLSFFVMAFAWQIYNKFGDHKIAEVMGTLTVVVIGSYHLIMQGWSAKSNMAFYLLFWWGAQHMLFAVISHVNKQHFNERYRMLMQKLEFIDDESYLTFYLVQGLYAWIVALPFYFIAKQADFIWLDMLLGCVMVFALLLGFVAELNLFCFKKNGGQGICQNGLWQMCRHPNYFFSWLFWIGMSILGVHDVNSSLSLLTGLFLFFIFRYIFVPATEEYLLGKYPSEYQEYQREVGTFFPFS